LIRQLSVFLFRDGPNGIEKAGLIRAYFQYSLIPAFSEKALGNILYAAYYCGCRHPPVPNSSTAVVHSSTGL
jgi:hypothetical protein